MSGIFSALSGGAVAKAWKRAQGKGVEGNLKGEGTVLGGMYRDAAYVQRTSLPLDCLVNLAC